MNRIPGVLVFFSASIAGVALALAGPAVALAKSGHGSHGSHGGGGTGGGNGGSAVSFAPAQHGSSGISGAVRPVSANRPVSSAAHGAGTGCGGRDERGNCLAARLHDPDYSLP